MIQGHKTNNVRHAKMALLSRSLFMTVATYRTAAASVCFLVPTTSRVSGLIIRPHPLQTYNPVFQSLAVGSTSSPFSSHVKNPSSQGSLPHKHRQASRSEGLQVMNSFSISGMVAHSQRAGNLRTWQLCGVIFLRWLYIHGM